jgi:aquaporin Z
MGFLSQQWQIAKPLIMEALGTFLLVAIGTSALVTLSSSGEATTASFMLVTLVAFSLTYGWLIYVFHNHNSGYFNPAVTLLLWLQRTISFSWGVSLVLSQLAGALVASSTVALLYGPPSVELGLGAVYPTTPMGPVAALVAELLGTLCLLIGISRLSSVRGQNIRQGLMVGVGMSMGLLLSIGVSGGSLNPARAIAPQLAAADLRDWWIYWVGPLGAAVAVWLGQKWLRVPQITVYSVPAAVTGQDRHERSLQEKAKLALDMLKQQPKPESAETAASAQKVPSKAAEPKPAATPDAPAQPAADRDTPIRPTFQPEETEASDKQSTKIAKPATPKPVPAPSAIRFVNFENPGDLSEDRENQ